jgi:Cu-Zn family superoxide dismutase
MVAVSREAHRHILSRPSHAWPSGKGGDDIDWSSGDDMKKQILALSFPLLVLGCMSGRSMKAPAASATIEPKSDSKVSGTAQFWEAKDGTVTMKVDVTGLTPGVHGFHIHETGDCSSPDAKSAGGHFNPMSMPHGSPDAASHHAGDFGNITADNNGAVSVTMTSHSVSLAAGPNSIIGKAVVVHADPDDLSSQPAGNAGKRIGCGVVSMTGSMQSH